MITSITFSQFSLSLIVLPFEEKCCYQSEATLKVWFKSKVKKKKAFRLFFSRQADWKYKGT